MASSTPLPSRKQLLSITPGHLDEMHEWHRAVVVAVIDGRYVDHGCPGGREVIIDPLIEAAEAVVSALEGSDFWGLGVVADLQTALTALGEG